MNYRFTPCSLILLSTTVIALIEAFAIWRRRAAPGAIYLAFLELAVAEWALGAAFEAAAIEMPLKLLWSKISYLGTTSGPLLYFLFAFEYSQNHIKLSPRRVALLFVFPVLTVVVAATNDWHHWLWTEISLNQAYNITVYGHGAWFWVFVVYNYVLLSAGLILLYRAMFRFPAFYRSQTGTLLVGSVLPLVGNIVYVSGLNPIPGMDFTPIAFALTGIILAWGILKLRILKLVPIARSQLIESMPDGVLVLDVNNHVVDINPAAQTIVGRSSPDTIGQSAAHLLAQWDLASSLFQAGAEMQTEVTLGKGQDKRFYELRLLPLRDARGWLTGRLVVLHDITKRKHMADEQEHLIHELQDALTQVKTLSGLLPICANCKKIQDDRGHWHSIEAYLKVHSDAEFSHAICPECMKELYSEYTDEKLDVTT